MNQYQRVRHTTDDALGWILKYSPRQGLAEVQFDDWVRQWVPPSHLETVGAPHYVWHDGRLWSARPGGQEVLLRRGGQRKTCLWEHVTTATDEVSVGDVVRVRDSIAVLSTGKFVRTTKMTDKVARATGRRGENLKLEGYGSGVAAIACETVVPDRLAEALDQARTPQDDMVSVMQSGTILMLNVDGEMVETDLANHADLTVAIAKYHE